jgi:tetratricopeptide (TPR) repeat protein
MRNQGDATEQILIGFPLTCDWCMVDETGYPEVIDDLDIYVNSLQVAYRQEELTFQSASELLSVSWAVFDMTFPPDQDVFIRVSYTAGGWGYTASGYRTFLYALITGAGWYDTIGSVDIVARLPYPANAQNTWIDVSGLRGDSPIVTPIISGNELSWHFDDLEPSADFKLTIVHPWLWFSALVEEENVRFNPQDGEAWGRLGLAYKQMVGTNPKFLRFGPDAAPIYSRAVEAYAQATTLLPDDPMWHAGFAELLYSHFYWTDYVMNWDNQPVEDLSALTRAVDEARRSLEIDPNNELALDILNQVSFTFPDAVQIIDGKPSYPILTSTAVLSHLLQAPTATIAPTSTPRPTKTPVATATSIATSTPEPTSGESALASPGEQTPAVPDATTDQLPTPPSESSSGGRISLWWIALPAVVLGAGLGWLLRRKHV